MKHVIVYAQSVCSVLYILLLLLMTMEALCHIRIKMMSIIDGYETAIS